MIKVITIRVKDGRQLVYNIYCVHLFLIQEWESNAGATEGSSSGPRVGTTVVKNIIIIFSFKENNIYIYIYTFVLSPFITTLHNIIIFGRYKHINYFVIARTLPRVYFFVFF